MAHTQCVAGKWVEFDPASTPVTNRVVRVVEGGLLGDAWMGRSNVIVHTGSPADTWNGVLPTNGTRSDWKVVGATVVELSAADRNAISNAQFQAGVAARQLNDAATKGLATNDLDEVVFTVTGRQLRAFMGLVMNEFNLLREEATVLRMELNKAKVNITNWRNEPAFATNTFPPRTTAQLRAAMRNELLAQPDTAP